MDRLMILLDKIDGIVWGPAMIILLVGTGLFLTVRLGLIQFRCLRHAIRCVQGKFDDPSDTGDVSHFRALCAALSATIGTGNIAGVATAIVVGGPGAVFWMWVTALVGMATKFTSCSLAVKYRQIHPDGSVSGGPMHILSMGLKNKGLGKMLAGSFAVFGVLASFGIGNMTQANSVIGGLKYMLPERWSETQTFLGGTLTASPLALIGGLILAFLVGLVILGGIKRIAHVASWIVPAMCIVYVTGCLFILITHLDKIGPAFALIFKYAFTPYAVGGGAVGIALRTTISKGVARGVFSNESGLGSAPIAHAAVRTNEMVREGMVAMLGPLIDTLIICTMTALTILVTDAHQSGLNGAELTAEAFSLGLSGWGHLIVGISLAFFAYSTTIAWSYYGDRCAEYLFGPRAVPAYRVIFVCLVFVGAISKLALVWTISDIFNALMAIPNLIGLVLLSGVVAHETRGYLKRLKDGDFEPPEYDGGKV
ncbi:MAG: sodium:alanine symporter family protein [Phycisphaeraceae bacterium]|nr:sodium:alanine symporter family protein [Phycisphaeraceae bacterium]